MVLMVAVKKADSLKLRRDLLLSPYRSVAMLFFMNPKLKSDIYAGINCIERIN
jgi:hypothetical protein